ncbi:MAG: BON domain-containing protein [Candidatus Korobacteraceae bacterium]
MRLKYSVLLCTMLLLGLLVGCSQERAAAPTENLEQSFEQAGLTDVDVDQDQENRTIRLTGEVQSQSAKDQAEQMAKQTAPGYTIANEILVRPEGAMGDRAENVAENMDDAIESRLKAEMAKHTWTNNQDADFSVNNGVVTLTGSVASQQQRSQFEEIAKAVPGVKQVVNQVEISQQRRRTPAQAME